MYILSACGGITIEYISTCIEALDPLFANGGYPRGNTILLTGGPGSGKSIFSMQFVCRGAKDLGEPGVYVTLDETPYSIKKNMAAFGWDFDGLIAEKKLIILDAASARIGSVMRDHTSKGAGVAMKSEHMMQAGLDATTMISQITNAIQSIGAKRLVIDSLSVMKMQAQTDSQLRTGMLRLSSALSAMDVTSLIINDAATSSIGITEFPQEAFVFDGLITLTLDTESQERRINIRKMRGTKHVIGSFRFDITTSGIKVIP